MQNALDSAWDLLRRGELTEAEQRCRSVLSSTKNRSVPAWIMLGSVLREQGKARDAESAFRRAIAIAPRDAYAHHNLGALLSAQDQPEAALSELNRAQGLGLNAHELHVNRGRAFLQLYRLEDAEKAYRKAVAINPLDPTAHAMLAQLRHMLGDPECARELFCAARDNPAHAGLNLTLADLQRRSGDTGAALATLRVLRERLGVFPELSCASARLLLDAGNLTEAVTEALRALQMRPGDTSICDIAASALLAGGRPQEAMTVIQQQRQRAPEDQRWIAYESTAARLLGQPRYRELCDYTRFVRVYDIDAPIGWNSVSEFNSALEVALQSRHLFKKHPLDQSLRNGSQTARNLLTDGDRTVQALLAAFAGPLADYVQAIDAEQNHPLYAGNRGTPALKGCWSVALHGRGFHVNHVHPQGWISSAYYVKTPASTTDAKAKHGWIKFGESPLPLPSVTPERAIEPRPGRLVLFPSYMWHGTNPVLDDEQRLSVAFDAVAPRSPDRHSVF